MKTSRFFFFCHIYSTRGFEAESIFFNRANNCCNCNMGKRRQISILCRHRKSWPFLSFLNLATPLDLFCNLPLPITSCVKTYETYEKELWWLLLLADNFRRQNVEVSKCDRFCPGILYCLELGHVKRVSLTAGLHPML